MLLADVLTVERVALNLAASTKEAALRELARLFAEFDPERVYGALREREALASTGVGSGVAMPHGRQTGVERVVAAVGIHRAGVDFDSVDGEPVRIFVAVLAPEKQASEQLKTLARLSRLLRSPAVREELLGAESPAAVLGALLREDERRLR